MARAAVRFASAGVALSVGVPLSIGASATRFEDTGDANAPAT